MYNALFETFLNFQFSTTEKSQYTIIGPILVEKQTRLKYYDTVRASAMFETFPSFQSSTKTKLQCISFIGPILEGKQTRLKYYDVVRAFAIFQSRHSRAFNSVQRRVLVLLGRFLRGKQTRQKYYDESIFPTRIGPIKFIRTEYRDREQPRRLRVFINRVCKVFLPSV